MAPSRNLVTLAALCGCVCAWGACASPAPEREAHLGALLGEGDVALAPVPAGRTDADRASAEGLVAEGVRLRDGGDLTGSQRALEEALRVDASLARGHVEWALTAEALGVDKALVAAHYQLGARLAPEDARAQLLAGSWAARHGDTEVALECFDRAVAADPKNVEALARRADLRVATGALADAVADYRAALAIDPKFVPAWVGLADAAERNAANDVAEEAHKALVELYPDVAHYRTKLVAFYRRTGQAGKAKAAERELEKVDPGDERKLRKLRR